MVKKLHALPYNPSLKNYARSLRKSGNLSEVILWNAIKSKKLNSLDFDRQKIIGDYIVDFYCHTYKLAVEIDGASHDSKGEYDEKRDDYLKTLGITVLHIPDSDVRNNLQEVIESILYIVANLQKQ